MYFSTNLNSGSSTSDYYTEVSKAEEPDWLHLAVFSISFRDGPGFCSLTKL